MFSAFPFRSRKNQQSPSLIQKYPRLKACIFIISYGRTGSTVLQRILNTLPNACIRGENNNILMSLLKGQEAAVSARSMSHLSTEKGPWYGAELVQPDAFAKALVSSFIETILCPPSDVVYLGIKEIRWFLEPQEFHKLLDFISSYFPNAHFVFNTRRVEEVRKSGWWWPAKALGDPDQIIPMMDRMFLAYAEKYPTRSFHIDYDDFGSGVDAFAPIFRAFGEKLDDNRLSAILRDRLEH